MNLGKRRSELENPSDLRKAKQIENDMNNKDSASIKQHKFYMEMKQIRYCETDPGPFIIYVWVITMACPL